MENKFAVTSSPHLRAKSTTQRIMMEVCLALAPAGVASVILFGWKAALLIAICVVSCVLSEFGWQKLMKQKTTISDWSAVVTGLLLAYNLPASAPWWMAVIGSVIAIVLVKQLFGGIGSNFMNPALTARAVLFISWATLMSAATPAPLLAGIDVVTGPTPLDFFKNFVGAERLNGIAEIAVSYTKNEQVLSVNMRLIDLFIGSHGGMLGETCSIALILGGVYLMVRRIADWRIPVTFIGTVFLCYLLKDGVEMALYQVLSGGLLLGAFFMATDYATSPITRIGRVIFGVGCGLFLFIIRAFCSYPEGCSFAILFMNVATPMIDRFTAPRPFGEVKKHG